MTGVLHTLLMLSIGATMGVIALALVWMGDDDDDE